MSSRGLTREEVDDRIARGLTNAVDEATSRSLTEIIRSNVVNRFNAILGVMCVVVIVAGSPADALFGAVLVVNSGVGIVQEYSTKRKLDRLALLHAPTSRVLRDGELIEVPTAQVVQDDLIELRAGDQVPADGVVVTSEGLEINQSNLTGEADSIAKDVDDEVMSGTVVTAGIGRFVAKAVGADARVHRIAAEAKEFSRTRSEIQSSIDRLLKYIVWIILVAIPLQLRSQFEVFGASGWRSAVVRSTAGIVGLVPEGLVLLTTLAFLTAAVQLTRQQVLVQELPAVEGLARVSVVCLDKTGTITTGDIVFERLELVNGFDSGASGVVADALGALMAVGPGNATLRAIAAAHPAPAGWIATDSVPFDSSRKWSGATISVNGDTSSWVLGAPEMLLPEGHPLITMVNEIAAQGRRVVLFARVATLDIATVREGLEPAALVVMSETIRPDAAETLAYFADQGVEVKIISGDNPVTVAAIAREVGLDVRAVVDAHQYGSNVEDVREIAATTTVFGRVSPEQKRSLVKALQEGDHVVAMTGDGVNDVLALKQADIGVAMNNGAPATKAVAQLVLLDGKFSHLPRVLAEGRRVIANVERVASLFVAKNAMSFVAIVTAGLLVVPFPLLPRHLSVLSSLAIGIPSFFLALGSNNRRYMPGFLRRVLRFALPAGVTVGAAVMLSNYVSRVWFPVPKGTVCDFGDLTAAAANRLCWHDGTASVAAALIVSMWILVVLARPFNKWKLILVGALSGNAVLLFTVPPLQRLFDFEMPIRLAVIVCAIGAGGAFVVESLSRFVRILDKTADS